MSANARIVIVNENDDSKVSVTDRGLKGVLAVEILDSSGNQITDFVGGSGAATVIGTGTAIIGILATQLSSTSIPCKRVIVHSAGGHIVVGDSNVVYTKASRRGIWLPLGNSMTFNISDVNLLYAIAESSSKNISYYYEV